MPGKTIAFINLHLTGKHTMVSRAGHVGEIGRNALDTVHELISILFRNRNTNTQSVI